MRRLLTIVGFVLLVAAPVSAQEHWHSVSGGLYYTCAVKSDGTLWCWGYNSAGQVGDGTKGTDRPTPTQVGIARDWATVWAGYSHTCGIKTGGTLWCWGYNGYGQVGDGTSGNDKTYPVQVGVATTWVAASGGWQHTIAIRSDGTLWAWGRNYYGELGDGTGNQADEAHNSSVPVQVGVGTTWNAVAAGGWHSLATKSDGTLWSWGRNYCSAASCEGHIYTGMLGDNTTENRNAPVQIGAAKSWSVISSGYTGNAAIATDGTLWTWGGSHQGELGHGTWDDYLVPTQVGSVNTWATVCLKNDDTHAIRTDGTLWAWGDNEFGQLGDGTTTDHYTPTQIGALTTWASVGRAVYHSVGFKTGDSLWVWGRNNHGQIGDGTTTTRLSPVEIAAPPRTFVVAASGGDYTTIQACADAVSAGDTCLVYPGTYAEHVHTDVDGTSGARVTFRAYGTVTMQGFDINHAYTTVEGFRATGYSAGGTGLIKVGINGDYCEVTNNYLYDGVSNLYGIFFDRQSDDAAIDCTIRGNTLTNLLGMYVLTKGSGHSISYNLMQYTNRMDLAYAFGSNITWRRNLWVHGTSAAGGNHQDIVGVFGDGTPTPHVQGEAQDIVFEENWVTDNEGAFCQITSSDIRTGTLYDDIKNFTFRRNLFVNVYDSGSVIIPGADFESNTFYRLAYHGSGLSYSGDLTAGDSSNGKLYNNAFLAATVSPDNYEYIPYTVMGAKMPYRVVAVHVTSDATVFDSPYTGNATTQAISADLVTNGYLLDAVDGYPTAKATTLWNGGDYSIDDFDWTLGSEYDAYKTSTFTHLMETVALDQSIRTTFDVDYNYVAGTVAGGYLARKTTGCGALNYARWNFCEPNGRNGGDPHFADYTSPLGADGLPWTLDDGFKPTAGSDNLCGLGEAGIDIGAYSCDASKVFVGGSDVPPAATALTVTGTTDPMLQWTQTGSAVVEFFLMVDSTTPYWIGLPTPSGTTYQARVPNLTAGSHTLHLMGCNTGGCTASAALTVVKM